MVGKLVRFEHYGLLHFYSGKFWSILEKSERQTHSIAVACTQPFLEFATKVVDAEADKLSFEPICHMGSVTAVIFIFATPWSTPPRFSQDCQVASKTPAPGGTQTRIPLLSVPQVRDPPGAGVLLATWQSWENLSTRLRR